LQVIAIFETRRLVVAALLGGETLTELRQSICAAEIEIRRRRLAPRAPFADCASSVLCCNAPGFALPVTDIDRLIVR